MGGKQLAEFEAAHGGGKIKALQRQLDAEHRKVESLAGVQNVMHVERSDSNLVRFALTGDRHTGSLYQHADALKAFYEHCEELGVDLVLDCGDILAGHNVYKGQEFELRDLGLDAQIDRLKKDAPQNVRTKFITGNHDASFKNQVGVVVGRAIEQALPEYQFLGEDQARVTFEVPNGKFEVMLLHPAGGAKSYALSYQLQNIIRDLSGGSKPDLLACGHYHKAFNMPSFRNVAGYCAGTFERQTPFMARQGLAAHVGAWIIEAWVGGDRNRIRSEFVAFYT